VFLKDLMDLAAPSKYPLMLVFLRDESPDSLVEAFTALQTIVLFLRFGAFRVSDLDLQNVSLAQKELSGLCGTSIPFSG
jgi:hypothetical protein